MEEAVVKEQEGSERKCGSLVARGQIANLLPLESRSRERESVELMSF